MPNLNVNNNIRTNSFYGKEIVYGTLTATTGLLLTAVSIASALCFYDNSKNSQSLTDKLNTFLNINNLTISLLAAAELNIGLDLMNLGRRRIGQACKGLKRNLTSSPIIASLLVANIEEINSYQEQYSIVTSNVATI